jgi:hypothetical protein
MANNPLPMDSTQLLYATLQVIKKHLEKGLAANDEMIAMVAELSASLQRLHEFAMDQQDRITALEARMTELENVNTPGK